MTNGLHAELARFQEDKACLRRRVRRLEAESAELERSLAKANRHEAALTAALEARRSACNEALGRAEEAERQIAEAQDELGEQRRLAAKHLAYAAECNARAEAAERQLAEARAAIAGALNELDEAPTGPNDPFIVAAQERLRAALQDRAPADAREAFSLGDQVEKFTGDYHLAGEVRAVFRTRAGKVRYVVEHEPGFLHIYSQENLRSLPSAEQ